MTKSYPNQGTPVNTAAASPRLAQAASSPSRTSAPAKPAYDRNSTRDTATFVFYYWEAYNEIVEPRRYDHYLIRKWLPDLGAVGLAVVKVLRDKCFHNPATGVLRDTCEMGMEELAEAVGCSRAFLFKQFSENRALQQFVRRIEQYQFVAGKPKRAPNRYQVCMDDPIHWDDMEHYDLLRSQKETERTSAPITRVWKGKPDANSRESTTKTHSAVPPKTADPYESTRKTHSATLPPYESTTETADTTYLQSTSETADTTYLQSAAETAIKEDLPSPLPIGSLTPSAGSPPINPPRGKKIDAAEAPTFDPLQSSWNVALALLAQIVNTATLNAHLKPMRLATVEDDTATLIAPTAFAKSWIEGRHRAEVEAALSEALGRPVSVLITTGGK